MGVSNIQRDDVTDMSTFYGKKSSISIRCKKVYFGSYNFEPEDPVIFTSKGVRIVAVDPLGTKGGLKHSLDIQTAEVVMSMAHFPIASATASATTALLSIYVNRGCALYILNALDIKDIANSEKGGTCDIGFSIEGQCDKRKIMFEFATPLPAGAKDDLRKLYPYLYKITADDAQQLLQYSNDAIVQSNGNENATSGANNSGTTQLGPSDVRQLLVYPPGKGGIAVSTKDYMCLATDQYLNDIIVDFYLKWIHNNLIETEEERGKTFMFSTFFYKRLAIMKRNHNNVSTRSLPKTAAEKRHAHVANWTKSVNIFKKDFLIVPINEHSHWFLAIICFPHLTGPVTFDTLQPVSPELMQQRNEDGSDVVSKIIPLQIDQQSEIATLTENSQQQQRNKIHAIKQPLILIFDSMSGPSRDRVVCNLHDYLTCEYKMKMPSSAPPRIFSNENMPGHHVKVPQQTNSTDCGLFLLQYVEQFYTNPIRDYRTPINQLSHWFDTIIVTRKREEILLIIKRLIKQYQEINGKQKFALPDIPLPTLNGEIFEQPGNLTLKKT